MTGAKTNENPGRDYELALGLALAHYYGLSSDRLYALAAAHRKFAPIKALADKLSAHIRTLDLLPDGATPVAILDTTQDDSVGPADLILRYRIEDCERDLGLSIKCQTDVSFNPTGRLFLTNEAISELEHELRTATVPAYKREMTQCFGRRITGKGRHDNWYRKRATVTTEFIHSIGKRVAHRWNSEMSNAEKLALANRLSHSKSPIPYLVLRISMLPAIVKVVESDEARRLLMDATNVTLDARKGTQIVYFFHSDSTRPIARMQVKFNDGILRFRGGREIVGDPFSSWNFELLPIA